MLYTYLGRMYYFIHCFSVYGFGDSIIWCVACIRTLYWAGEPLSDLEGVL